MAERRHRSMVFPLLAIFIILLMIVAFATKLYRVDFTNTVTNREIQIDADIWYICTRNSPVNGDRQPKSCIDTGDGALECGRLRDTYRATRAFYVMAAIFTLFNLLAGLMDHYGTLNTIFVRPDAVLAILSLCIFIFGAIGWSIALSIPFTGFCQQDAPHDTEGYSWGASAFLLVIVTFLALVEAVLALIIRRKEVHKQEEPKQEEPTTVAGDNNAPNI